MKYALALITASLIAVSFTGCRLFKKAVKDTSEEIVQESEASDTVESNESKAKQTCTVGDISFEVPSDWIAMEDYEGTFSSPNKKNVYQLQGESILGSYTPDEFFNELVDFYSSSYEIIRSESSVSPLTTADGTECFAGRIEITGSNALFSIDVLIAPDKNTVLTYAAQCPDDDYPETDIRDVTKTTVFNIGTEDMISGKKFKLSNGGEIHLNSDGSFKCLEEYGNIDSSYFEGSYEVYYGQAAFDKLVSMPEYGLTEEELESTLAANMNGYSIGGSSAADYFNDDETSSAEGYRICRDTFYAIIMQAEKLYEAGETSVIDNTALYIGYYVPELYTFDLLNTNSYTYTQWTEIE